MTKMEKINRVLRKIDNEKPYYLDKIGDEEVNNLDEVKVVLGGFKIEGFSVRRDNQMKKLADGSEVNIGDNKLLGFDYRLVM